MSIPEDASEYLKNKAYLDKWDGQGFPPVGCECEYKDTGTGEWIPVEIKYSSSQVVVFSGRIRFRESAVEISKDVVLDNPQFRPIRSEADKKRDEVTQSILDILNDYDFELVHIRSDQKRIATDIVERIASGMIPHIRID